MAGQVRVVIADKEWLADLATTSWEQVQGLGGITGISPGNGMFFDLGYEQAISVTTEPMLFPLDIAFFSEALEVTEVYQNVAPGYHVNSIAPARYFLEVNAGELNGIAAGEPASLEVLTLPSPETGPNWVTMMAPFFGIALLSLVLSELLTTLKPAAAPRPKALSFQPSTLPPDEKGKTPFPLGHTEGLPVAHLLEKWQKAKSRNSALALQDLETLGTAYDTADCKQALADYRGIERADYGDQEEYQEARDEAWESFLECLESLVGEEEEKVAVKKQPSAITGKGQTSKGICLDYLVDSPEYLTQTIEDIGYRDKIDRAFLKAIARSRGSR